MVTEAGKAGIIHEGIFMVAVQTENLRRVYKGQNKRPSVTALDDVNLSIEEGEIRGLLGPNGAGKTTLVKVLSTVLLPTAGSASIQGHDVVRETKTVQQLIGIVFGGDRGLYARLTSRQNLGYWAALYRVPTSTGKRRASELLDRVGMADRADDLVETYSRGMKQRLHLARGLVADAKVLFLDEPTTGLDPVAAREFRRLILELRGEGRTILITTHDMAEAEEVCDRVSLIDHGRILAMETPRTLGRLIASHERIDFVGGPAELPAELVELAGVKSVTPQSGEGFRIEVSSDLGTRSALAALVEAGVMTISTSRPSLEEVYVHIIGDRGLEV